MHRLARSLGLVLVVVTLVVAGAAGTASAATAYGFSPGSPADSPFALATADSPLPLATTDGSFATLGSSLWSPLSTALGIHDLRIFVPIEPDGDNPNAELNDPNSLQSRSIAYVQAAEQAGYDVLVQLSECRDHCQQPDVTNYAADVQSIVSQLPGVHEWSAWDEPDPGGEFHIAPTEAAELYTQADQVLASTPGHAGDTLAAGEFALNDPDLTQERHYVSAYRTALSGDLSAAGLAMPTVWSIHPYVDVRDHPNFTDPADPAAFSDASTLTGTFIGWLDSDTSATPAVWLTESGVLLSCGGCALNGNAALQEQAAHEFLALPQVSGQITRDYYYDWKAPSSGFDSGLLDTQGLPRPAWCVLLGVDPTQWCGGDTSADAGQVASGVPAADSPPTITPSQSGAGVAVDVKVGGWSGDPTSYAVQWWTCSDSGTCMQISGATGPSYTPTASEEGDSLKVTVTAGNASGTGAPAESPLTSPLTGVASTLIRPVSSANASMRGTPARPRPRRSIASRVVHFLSSLL